jgi:hypothetical protein
MGGKQGLVLDWVELKLFQIVIFVFNMKKSVYLIAAGLLILASCTKEEPSRRTGTDSIDNIRYMSTTYFLYGFTFSSGQLVSTEAAPGPDITVDTISNPARLYLQANNLKPSFLKAGDYPDEAAAKAAFDNLKSFTPGTWLDLADPVEAHQIWIYRSGADTYSKFRIVNTTYEKREVLGDVNFNYGEVTFQWAHQSDGSLTFP